MDQFKENTIKQMIENSAELLRISEAEFLKAAVRIMTNGKCPPHEDCPEGLSCWECWEFYLFEEIIY